MANFAPAKHASVTLGNMSGDGDEQHPGAKGDCKQCFVAEHLVFFNMPYLQGDQEAAILHALYDLRFKFDDILVLLAGRTLNKVDNVTHALFMRFPNVKILQSFYDSNAINHVRSLIIPHLQDEYTFDYVTKLGYLDMKQNVPICASATFLRKKRSYVKDFTTGSNLFLTHDQIYTHGCVAYVKTVDDLDHLAKNSKYTKVLEEKVFPLSATTITVNIMKFRPIYCAL